LFESGQRGTLWDIRVWLQFADALDIPRVALLPLVLGRADAASPDGWQADAGESRADVGVLEDADVDLDRRGFGGLATGAVAALGSLEALRPIRAAAKESAAEEFCARFDAAERVLTAV
jgi:hypothetical protein